MTTERWTFFDPSILETYEFPINPDSMSSAVLSKGLTFGRARRPVFGEIPGGNTTFRAAPRPVDWQFGGVIRTQQHHDDLYEWAGKRRMILMLDHLGRYFMIYLTSFEPTDRTPTKDTPWRMRYVMKAQLFGQLVLGP